MAITKVGNLPGLADLIVKWSRGEAPEPKNVEELIHRKAQTFSTNLTEGTFDHVQEFQLLSGLIVIGPLPGKF